MKNLSNLLNLRLLTILVTLVFGSSGFAQKYDTLHLNYHHTATTAHDTTQKRIDAWVKKLNKQHVDVKVYAYYHKPEFKKFAEQRIEDMFIVLNRKARDLITIQEMTSKKGKDFQRTMVDIIYTVSGSKADADKAAAEEKAKKEVAEKLDLPV